jgi:hypothetical protein
VDHVHPIGYREAFEADRLAAGTYVFADHERLTVRERSLAVEVWDRLAQAPMPTRLLNDPRTVLRRYQVLRALKRHGINDHTAYRLPEAGKARFPVFVRRASVHNNSLTPLLHSRQELRRAIHALAARGHGLRDLLVVEYEETADEDGLYHMYGAYIVGDHVVPGSLVFDRNWIVNPSDSLAPVPAQARLEREYLEHNPHEHWQRKVFRLANIDYGRMDFSIDAGRPRIWEINTHPTPFLSGALPQSSLPEHKKIFNERFKAAWLALEMPGWDGEPAAIAKRPTKPPRRIAKDWPHGRYPSRSWQARTGAGAARVALPLLWTLNTAARRGSPRR